MPGLLIETAIVTQMIGGAGIAEDTTGRLYNNRAGADASNGAIDAMLYNEALVLIATGNNAKGFTADLIASPTTTPTDTGAAVVGSFGTLDNTSMYTGYAYNVANARYLFLRTDGTTASANDCEITAGVVLAQADRPKTTGVASASFAVVS
jgi:hypothetical protein